MNRICLTLCLVILTLTTAMAQRTTKTSPKFGPPNGKLLIVGGGVIDSELWQKFVELAGGGDARIVVVPTAGMTVPDDGKVPESQVPRILGSLGVHQITILHTTDRSVADSVAFIKPIQEATAVWFDGGRQWHLADSYLHSKTEKAFHDLLERGGIIGGTSAGATIQGSYLVRGDTSGPDIVQGDHTEGFNFLRGVAIDQHILARNRQFDLVPLIETHPDLLGIGINESTAILVTGDQFEVFGASYVAITDANQWKAKRSASPNDSARKGKIYFIGRGTKFDLVTRRVLNRRG